MVARASAEEAPNRLQAVSSTHRSMDHSFHSTRRHRLLSFAPKTHNTSTSNPTIPPPVSLMTSRAGSLEGTAMEPLCARNKSAVLLGFDRRQTRELCGALIVEESQEYGHMSRWRIFPIAGASCKTRKEKTFSRTRRPENTRFIGVFASFAKYFCKRLAVVLIVLVYGLSVGPGPGGLILMVSCWR
jgi:hypothetical protein